MTDSETRCFDAAVNAILLFDKVGCEHRGHPLLGSRIELAGIGQHMTASNCTNSSTCPRHPRFYQFQSSSLRAVIPKRPLYAASSLINDEAGLLFIFEDTFVGSKELFEEDNA